MSDYREPRTYPLKPYQSKEKGNERLLTGVLLSLFGLFNLYLSVEEGLISLLFGLFFGWSGLKNISLGLKLRQLPERERAYRVTPEALYKVLEGRDLARLAFAEVSGIWFDQGRTTLSIMNARGVEELKRSELSVESDWEYFTHQIERSITALVYRSDPSHWTEVQRQSEAMSDLNKRKPLGVYVMLTLITLFSLIYFYFLQFHLPYLIQVGRSELLNLLLGAPSPLLEGGLAWNRVLTGLLIPISGLSLLFTIFSLLWVGRVLERAWGTRRIIIVFLGGYLAGLLPLFFGNIGASELYLGSIGGSVALIATAHQLMGKLTLPPPLKRARTSSLILTFVFIFIISFELSIAGMSSTSWISSLCFGVLMGKIFTSQCKAGGVWTLPESSSQAQWFAALSGLGLLSAALVSLLGEGYLHDATSPARIAGHLTPSAQIELSQRCSGAPLSRLTQLPTEVTEHLPPPDRCPNTERQMLVRSLKQLEGFFPIADLSSARSSEQELQTHPSLYLPLQRALALSLFEPQISQEERAHQLAELALTFPQDLFGDLLTALISSSWQPPQREEALAEKTLDKDHQRNTLQTRAGQVDLSLHDGQLSWVLSEVSPLSTRDTDDESVELKMNEIERLHWFAVTDHKGRIFKILALEFNQDLDRDRAMKSTHHERLGTSKEAYDLVALDEKWTSLLRSQFQHTDPKLAHLYHWRRSPLLEDWISEALKIP